MLHAVIEEMTKQANESHEEETLPVTARKYRGIILESMMVQLGRCEKDARTVTTV